MYHVSAQGIDERMINLDDDDDDDYYYYIITATTIAWCYSNHRLAL